MPFVLVGREDLKMRHTAVRPNKIALGLLVFLLVQTVVQGQATSSGVDIVTTYSQNGRFYLKSIPFDNEFPTLPGKTYVYESGNPNPLYVFDRGFDSVDDDSNNLILSNDGAVIFYVIPGGRMKTRRD